MLGFFSYYSKWIKNSSDKIASLVKSKSFSLSIKCQNAFQNLKLDKQIDENEMFELDASDVAISCALNQNSRPAAFYTRTLQDTELRHPPIEKEESVNSN